MNKRKVPMMTRQDSEMMKMRMKVLRKRRYVKCGRREWGELGTFDRIALLDSQLESEIDVAILGIATEKMNEFNLSDAQAQ